MLYIIYNKKTKKKAGFLGLKKKQMQGYLLFIFKSKMARKRQVPQP